jgi:hypothetical protein
MDLKTETLQAWNTYVGAVKLRMEERAKGQAPFLWVDQERERAQRVRAGEILVEPMDGDSPHTVPRGLIHDWVGAMFVPQAKLDDVTAVLDDYGRYKDFYRPMVAKSRLLAQTPDHEKVTLLMVQKAYSVIAAVETDNAVDIARLDADRAYSFSSSARVQEIADYGKPSEHALPEDRGLRLADVYPNAGRAARRRSVRRDGIDGLEPRHPLGVSLARPAAGGTPAPKHPAGDPEGHAGRRERRNQRR